jgi:hypothetical protein
MVATRASSSGLVFGAETCARGKSARSAERKTRPPLPAAKLPIHWNGLLPVPI